MKQGFTYSNELLIDVKKHISTETYKFIFSPKFIFLCGKGFDCSNPSSYSLTNRGVIENYISKKDPDANVVLSEKLWDNALLKEIDLLTFEEYLAEVSDYVILFVESMGSACELGAFTFSDKLLMKKLLIIMSEKYKTGESFIKNGPIAKAIKKGTPVLYADLAGPLLGSRELVGRIDDIVSSLKERNALNKRKINTTEKVMLNSFIIEMIELVRLFQPIKREDIVNIYKAIKTFPSSFIFIKNDGTHFKTKIQVSYVLDLLVKLDIFRADINGYSLGKELPYENFMFSFTPLTLSKMRSKILSRKYKYKEI